MSNGYTDTFDELDDSTSGLKQKAIEKLMEILEEEFGGDSPIFDVIAPVIPAIVELALEEGLDNAKHTLIGLMADDPYPHWEKLINAASPDVRVQIMEEARQAAIADNLRKIRSNERWNTMMNTAIKVAIGILTVLLAL